MINKPFIHLLKSPYHHYLFDVNTNSIVRISEELFRYLNMQKEDSPASSCALPEELSAEWETLVKKWLFKAEKARTNR